MAVEFVPIDRDTPYLFPPSVQDYLPENHLACFVAEMVDQLDRFCQLNPAEAKAIARRNHLSISSDTGHFLPRRKGAATQESIVR